MLDKSFVIGYYLTVSQNTTKQESNKMVITENTTAQATFILTVGDVFQIMIVMDFKIIAVSDCKRIA